MASPVAHYKANDTVQGLRILQELGQGAASTVYLAQDPKSKQIWSLKHVHRETEKDDRFLEQAVGEYEIAGKLKHPNIREIPRIHKERAKIFTLADVFLVMEYVDGVSMERRPKSVTLDMAVEVFHQAALAVQHMHAKGYVHADMKPNNIMVMPGPKCKIIDLGQSCEIGTTKKRIQGTPDYIAPEQAQLKPVVQTTDVFNFGATMYWILSAKAIPTMMNQPEGLTQTKDPSLLPRPAALGAIDARLHPKLCDLVAQCIENDPDGRPQSMQEVADRLQLVLGMMRASAKPSGKSGGKKGANPSGETQVLLDAGSTAGVRMDSRSFGSTVQGVKLDQQAGR